ncbi:MAG TPA: DUF6496 domain-containing protein, partial [Polyangiaceae bacterium]|nr:DUF6496 domain-containing protein [Polyangiaceae bacterium]
MRTKKTTSKKTSTKSHSRSRKKASKRSSRSQSGSSDYGDLAGKKVERAMHEMKRGELVSGKSGKRVTSRKQAVAIGLSE